jgi:flagellar assembly protein FliH
LSNIFKSAEVILDSKKYSLTEKAKIVVNEEKIKTNNYQDTENFAQMKEDILESAKKESDEIFKDSLKEKEKMLSDAYDESIKIRETARKDGFDEGKNDALEAMKEKEKETIDEMLKYKNDVVSKYDLFFETREEEIVKLVIHSVEKILNKNIDEDKELIGNLVKRGIERSIFTETIVIRVSEKDYENALANKARILIHSKDIKSIKFVTDYSLVKGECIIESEIGNVDVGVNTQFRNLKELYSKLIKD